MSPPPPQGSMRWPTNAETASSYPPTSQVNPSNGPFTQGPRMLPFNAHPATSFSFTAQSNSFGCRSTHTSYAPLVPINASAHMGGPIQQSLTSVPPSQGPQISSFNTQPAIYPPPNSQLNPFDGGSTCPMDPHPLSIDYPAHVTGQFMSNTPDSNDLLGLVGMQGPDLLGMRMTGSSSGHATHPQQQMYGIPQSTPHSERSFNCDQCPQTFTRNHDLKRHQRRSHAIHPQQQMYRNPQSTLHSERYFDCDQCSYRANRNTDLQKHRRSHLAKRPYVCENCGLSFPRRNELNVSFSRVDTGNT